LPQLILSAAAMEMTLQLTNFADIGEPQHYHDDSDGQEALTNDIMRAISRLRPSDFDPDGVILRVDRLTEDHGEPILTIDWNDIELPGEGDDSDDDEDYNRGPELTSHCQSRIDSLFH
jgi:hypothetical protein